MNFGFFGGAIFIAMLGAILAMVTAWTEQASDPGRDAFVAVALCFVLLYARAESGNIVRGLVWYGGFPYFIYRFMRPFAMRTTLAARPQIGSVGVRAAAAFPYV